MNIAYLKNNHRQKGFVLAEAMLALSLMGTFVVFEYDQFQRQHCQLNKELSTLQKEKIDALEAWDNYASE
ncbi:hypothetical protein [Leuconostoc falkenbergense]|uniref:hypothetical protein n=1 Tax=Leuconostoc falkenbergense TaxID=2766470 RepID=UPI002958D3D8|nr:hypothetical protein [Leuconostoc falkenbergense]MDV8950990.1 hypothetical protein [Leuconostoc falkenbergense]